VLQARVATPWWGRLLGTWRQRGVVLALLAIAIAYPFAVGTLAARLVTRLVRERVGISLRIGSGRAGLGGLTFRDLEVAGAGPEALTDGIVVDAGGGGLGAAAGRPRADAPRLLHIERVYVPFAAMVFGRHGTVHVSGLLCDVVRGGPDDNVTELVRRLRERRSSGQKGARGAERSLPAVVIDDGAVKLADTGSGLRVRLPSFAAAFFPGNRASVLLGGLEGVLALGSRGNGPRFGAASIELAAPLEPASLHLAGYPTLTIAGGFATPLPTLALTGIRGSIQPGPKDPKDSAAGKQLVVALEGSYGGARETLWTAKGGIDPAAHEGQLSLLAERFSLAEIADVLPKEILSPKDTQVNAAFDVSWADGAVRFGGDLQVAGLSLEHPAVASEPIRNLGLSLVLRGTAFPATRRVLIERLEGRMQELRAKLSGFVELAPGSFAFEDGNKLGFLPRMELTLEVPKLPCAKVLSNLPAAVVPHLQGFVLDGIFGATIETHIDYAHLDDLELKGKVDIDGCRVLKAPEEVQALIKGASITQRVEVPRAYGAKGGTGTDETEEMEFVVGPENPDFVPYEQIAPAFIAAIMTTEDNGFFKHRGWVSSEFKTALKRNLKRGGFRGGASSITMQMVKNVLLSHEKTLSRKMQELFLVWYLEQEIPKERILELYFNAIEFGPRIYGIGPAAQHYFGKSASDLTPLEGAFFSSILPSPKRRYVQYCHGAPLPPWDRYVRRILGKVHERGRLTDEEYEAALEQKLVFDRREGNFSERQCVEWVKKITTRPEADVPPDSDVAGGEGDPEADKGPLPMRKLRRLFASEAKRAPRAPRNGP
jgi:hypothetical protein